MAKIKSQATLAAMAAVEEYFRLYKRWRWIRGIYWDFYHAYCDSDAPVSVFDKPEIERLEEKISAWEDKAHYKKEDAEAVFWALKPRFWHVKAFRARFTEVARYVSKIELGLPDDWVFPDDF